MTGREIERVYADKGYRGHDATKPLRVFISGQRRGVHGQIKRELRRRSAIEATIGHMKIDGHLGRNFLKGRHGDQANAVLTAVGYNLRLILNWLKALLRKILKAILAALGPPPIPNPAFLRSTNSWSLAGDNGLRRRWEARRLWGVLLGRADRLQAAQFFLNR